ncbi:hypothetical protein KQI30_08865 [Clostridium bornimense]|uniref:hypothetical protein n=2 Tax=Clostridium TaxID=1485 RepID=UPI001C104D8B|nr:hypothetical protein [Clostridium bornimense]MBU5316380.1 hypothetical protein [Clostridium bornimense]
MSKKEILDQLLASLSSDRIEELMIFSSNKVEDIKIEITEGVLYGTLDTQKILNSTLKQEYEAFNDIYRCLLSIKRLGLSE